ncbi:helix-hairpin-helix domain-containing protein [Rhizobium sp. P32RR-XVIII]|uniref:helix-hairpin-helix domain-containing protein n=1 Tax=Rhizobium sp. P32RR-XVIII TaxID=2726738 RepID=UPI002484D207|nr:helix-hairpin-helix domain-containing protein [Rhizobium sp. P32RR-XVIII]
MKTGQKDNRDPPVTSYLPGWVARALAANGIRRLAEAASMSDADLLKLPGIGKASVKLIRSASRKSRREHRGQTSGTTT